MKTKFEIKQRAFTLIEILVVVAIIGILSTVVVVNVSGARASSRYAKTAAEMADIAKATLTYKAEHNGVRPTQWSGYNDWKAKCDSCGAPSYSQDHIFNNNPIDTTNSSVPNEFLVNYMGGKKFAPECSGSSYAYYIYGKSGISPDRSFIVYFTPGSGSGAAYFLVDGSDKNSDGTSAITEVDISLKTTKKITCKEAGGSAFNN